jgi:hypothetical protein
MLLISTSVSSANFSSHYKTIQQAVERGDPYLDFKFRQEFVNHNSLKDARATTIGTKLGYNSAEFYSNNIALEMVNVTSIFGQHYNPNVYPLQKSSFATIYDPKGTGITLANIKSEYFPSTNISLGRQMINLDNHRMVGNDSFRQFPTSFDALSIKNTTLNELEIFYSFANHINTFKNSSVSSEGRRRLRTHLLNCSWQNFMYGKLTGYIYYNKDLTILTNSNITFGGRAAADQAFTQDFDFDYELELAAQKNQSNNPNKYSALYSNMSAGKQFKLLAKDWSIGGKIGFELISSHNAEQPNNTFSFPLGAWHGFNGLAEAFNPPPTRGIRDYYVNISGFYRESIELTSGLHVFQFAKNSHSKTAGFEIDMSASFQINPNLNARLIIAKLNSKNSTVPSITKLSGPLSYHAI